jgi:hypothetical protein
MKGHRVEPRTALMALVEVSWQEPTGIANVAPARMEDTSPSGACIRLPRSIRTGSEVTVKRRSEEFSGITRYCRRDGADYVLGLRRVSKEAAAKAQAQTPRSPMHAAAHAQVQAPASAQAHAAINAVAASPIANLGSSARASARVDAPDMQVPDIPPAIPSFLAAAQPQPYVSPAPASSVPQPSAPAADLMIAAKFHAESQGPVLTQPDVTSPAPELRSSVLAEALPCAPALTQSPVPHVMAPPTELRSFAPREVPLPLQPSSPVPAQLRTQPPVFAEGRPHGDALAQPHPSALTRSVSAHPPMPIRAELQLTEPPLAQPPPAQPPTPRLPHANYEVLPQPIAKPQLQLKPPLEDPINAPVQAFAQKPIYAPIDAPAELLPRVLSEVCVPVPAKAPTATPAATPPATTIQAPVQTLVEAPVEAPIPPSVEPPIQAPVQASSPAPSPMQNANNSPEVPATSLALPVAPVSIAPAAHVAPPPARQEVAPAKFPAPAGNGNTQARVIPIPEMEHAPQISQHHQLQQLSPPEVMEMHMQEPTPDKERKAMSSKWMNLTMGRQKQEASNSQTNSKSSSSAPVALKSRPAPADIEVADEIHTDAETMGRGRARPQGDLQSMDDIYRGAGIMTPRMGYSATKIVEMLESSHMRGLSSDAKRAAVLMALDAASISVSEVERDARRRQDALDAYEADQRQCFEEYWTRKADANAQIQAEIDWLTERSMERIKRNLDDIAAEKAEFARWHTMKQQEAARISEAVALCSKPSAAIASPALSAGASAASSASSAAAAASSSAAASVEPAGGLMLALAEVEHAAKPS